jgi:parallel beta-helix repeat protein
MTRNLHTLCVALGLVGVGPALGHGSANPERGLRGAAQVRAAATHVRPNVCSRYASTNGSDAATGRKTHPYRTLDKLVSILSPGETGCLLPGVFVEDVTIRRGGVRNHRITVRSAPGPRATVRGRFYIADSANYVTVENLKLDGRNEAFLPSPTVNGDYSVWRNLDVTNYHAGTGDVGGGICFHLGSTSYGTAYGTVIENDRIHDCGISDNHNHGIYANTARDTIIRNNYFYDNGDRAIQLYPNADNTLIEHNVIDGNGEGIIFSGDEGYASENNTVRWNIISNSRDRWNVESYYPDGNPIGSGNVVTDNCVWPSNQDRFYNSRGGIQSPGTGFTALSNRVADPRYVDRLAKNFRLKRTSPCSRMHPR